MGLEAHVFKELVAARDTFRRPINLLSLSYPDLLVGRKTLEEVGVKEFPVVPNSGEIASWHGWKEDIYDTTSILRQLSIEPRYGDIRSFRGVEEYLDLNNYVRLPPADIILDPGTFEHCFNIGNAFRLVRECLHIGGFVIHVNPVSCLNHGFYNFSPTLYVDFYEQNGFEVRSIQGMHGPWEDRKIEKLPAFDRVSVRPEVMGLVVARKVSETPFVWPMQTKYARMVGKYDAR